MKAERVRVWHLLSNRWNSAVTEYALSAARSLNAVGCHSFFSPLAGSPAQTRARQYGLETHSFKTFSLGGVARFNELLEELRPQVIITYGGREMFIATWLAGSKVARNALLYRFHGQDGEGEKPFFKWRYRISHRRLDGVLTPSRRLAALFRSLSPLAVNPILLGIDTDKYTYKSARYEREARPSLVIVGRLDPIKGHQWFFRVMQQLLSSWSDADGCPPYLHVIGEPANLDVNALSAMALAEGLDVDKDLVITARRLPNIAGHMAKATLGVIPSLGSEVICRVLEEFLLCGTPVITSGVGSLEEALFSGAGASYRKLDLAGTVALTKKWLLRSRNEEEAERAARAAKAEALFALKTMGTELKAMVVRDQANALASSHRHD